MALGLQAKLLSEDHNSCSPRSVQSSHTDKTYMMLEDLFASVSTQTLLLLRIKSVSQGYSTQ